MKLGRRKVTRRLVVVGVVVFIKFKPSYFYLLFGFFSKYNFWVFDAEAKRIEGYGECGK